MAKVDGAELRPVAGAVAMAQCCGRYTGGIS